MSLKPAFFASSSFFTSGSKRFFLTEARSVREQGDLVAPLVVLELAPGDDFLPGDALGDEGLQLVFFLQR
jgi:hypothetical protein